jgi:hypothetical protein
MSARTFIAILLTAAGCAPEPSQPPAIQAEPPTEKSVGIRAREVSPLVMAATPHVTESSFQGEVLERIEAGPYLYFSVAGVSGEPKWISTLDTTTAEEGDWVAVKSVAVRDNFRSRRLARTFERLHFGVVVKTD